MAKAIAAGKVPRLDRIDLGAKLDRKSYDAALSELQLDLTRIQQAYLFAGHSAVIVFEGWDAAGKGGTIRRMSVALDPRSFKVWPIGAPRNYYLQRHFLTRFFERLPPQGAISAFDRSWYGRVLVERVEELCSPADWMRAYREINDFEEELVRHRIIVVKFWLAISKDEQLRRFEKRQEVEFKRFKITEDDWRNREKWDLYEQAVGDMVDRTSSAMAPWTLVEAEDKRFARIKVLKTLCRRIEKAL